MRNLASVNDDVEIIGGSEKVPIVIAEYDPRWPARYAESWAAISAALGRRALRLEHIGSTAVPGLGAKPIVDILVVVADSADEASYLPHLERAGYALRVREPGLNEHRMLRSPARDVHVHVYSQGSREIERYLLLRNLLRQDARARAVYEGEKRRLSTQEWDCMDDYAAAKTETIEALIAQARLAGVPW